MKFGLEPIDLAGELGGDRDERGDVGVHGGLELVRSTEVVDAERVADLEGFGIGTASTAATTQRCCQSRCGQLRGGGW